MEAGYGLEAISGEIDGLKAIYNDDNVAHHITTIRRTNTTNEAGTDTGGIAATGRLVKVLHSSSGRTAPTPPPMSKSTTVHEICIRNLEPNGGGDGSSGAAYDTGAVQQQYISTTTATTTTAAAAAVVVEYVWKFNIKLKVAEGTEEEPFATEVYCQCDVDAGWISGSEAGALALLAIAQLKEQQSVWSAVEAVREAITKPPAVDTTDLVTYEGGLLEDEADEGAAEVHVPVIDDLTQHKLFTALASSLNIELFHGTPIIDRKSIFQAHLATVHDLKQVDAVRNVLLSDSKIARAAHNIMAYRIRLPQTNSPVQRTGAAAPHVRGTNAQAKGKAKGSPSAAPLVTTSGSLLQDHDSDGENHAGGRLQHLLEILNVVNVVVVVTRWYGGILLGPDRFRHINNAARSALVARGDVPNPQAAGGGVRANHNRKQHK